MNGIDTPIPLVLIALWASASLGLLLLSHLRLRHAVPTRFCWGILGFRLAALTIVLLLLLQPYRRQRTPDREGFRLALLLDASQSMSVRDLPDSRERIDVLREALRSDRADTLVRRLSEAYRLDVRAFADDVRVVRPGSALPYLPGTTRIGEALLDVLAESAGSPLGGVLLVSDGLSNAGISPAEACKLYRSRGVPVSTIGVGRRTQTADLRVRFASDQLRCRKGETVTLTVLLENRFERDVSTTVSITDGADVVAREAVSIPARERIDFSVEVEPWRAGFITYRVEAEAVPGDPRPDNDVDYAGVQVEEPETFRILFLGGTLGWEYRFLKILADSNRQLSLAAAIQTGPTTIYQVGLAGDDDAEGQLRKLPAQPDQLNRFEAILLDTRVVPALDEPGIEALTAFVDRRGGGLLMFGPTDHLPDELLPLLPVPRVPARTLERRRRLDVNPEFIFDQAPAGILDGHAGLPVEPQDPVFFTEMLKRSAREAVRLRHTGLAALSAQSYGSGRSAYLGMEASWRWRLKDRDGESGHDAFWNALLVWLASSSRQRVHAAADGIKAGVGEEVSLDVDVLGRDFRPSPDARVLARVTESSGAVTEIPLDPAPAVPGRYEAVFFPKQAGEHHIRYDVRSGDDHLITQAHFLARKTGVENEETGYREDVLRDIARITGGQFRRFDQIDSVGEIPLNPDVPMKTARRLWSRHAIWVLLLIFFLGGEWTLRRRLGLK